MAMYGSVKIELKKLLTPISLIDNLKSKLTIFNIPRVRGKSYNMHHLIHTSSIYI